MIKYLLNKLVGKSIGAEGWARLNHVASIEKTYAEKPYSLLSNFRYKVGDIVNACFVTGESCFGNDYLPAKIARITPNGRVELIWEHTLEKTNWHPNCVIHPKYIAVRN